MSIDSLERDNVILDIIKEKGPLTTKEIVIEAARKSHSLDTQYINSLLYGHFREAVIRERNQYDIPTWRIKTGSFEAAQGYETILFNELLKQRVVMNDEIFMDYEMRNPRGKRTYHLDIAIIKNNKKLNIEVDGFDHMRADARLSIQNQIRAKKNTISIDWMDNEKSYVDFRQIDSRLVNQWCNKNLQWCITYHEELLWPHDITRNIFLIDNGWQVMRLWNMEVKNDLARCIAEIKDWISLQRSR